MEIWNYFRDHQSDVLHWTWTTVWLAGVPLVVGLIIALPVGWVASRFRLTYLPVATVAGILYTIPSLVLFFVLPGILGTGILDPINVAVALTVYTVALLARVVADGLNSVDATTMAAASAMGLTGRQRLFSVQLPMSIPVIGAGLRVAAVSNVSLVSVASLLGVPQLGSLFVAGNQANSVVPILLGIVLILVLALLFDVAVLMLIRVLAPWQRAVRAR